MWRLTVLAIALYSLLPCIFSLPHTSSYPVPFRTGKSRSGRKLAQYPEEENPPSVFKLSCSNSGPFPYTASVRGPTGHHRCGAVLIRPDAVLTAASCVDPRNHNDGGISQLYLGGFNRDDPIQKRKPVLTIIHESYTGDPRDGYDIAVIKLNKPSCLEPVPFIGRQTDAGEVYILLGFGRTGPNAAFATTLYGANVTNFDINQCNKIFGADPPLDERKVCTKNLLCNCGAACEGDEGSPVVLRETTLKLEDTLIAIASYSEGGCGLPDTFSVHTDIQPFENWLRRQLQSEKFLNA